MEVYDIIRNQPCPTSFGSRIGLLIVPTVKWLCLLVGSPALIHSQPCSYRDLRGICLPLQSNLHFYCAHPVCLGHVCSVPSRPRPLDYTSYCCLGNLETFCSVHDRTRSSSPAGIQSRCHFYRGATHLMYNDSFLDYPSWFYSSYDICHFLIGYYLSLSPVAWNLAFLIQIYLPGA